MFEDKSLEELINSAESMRAELSKVNCEIIRRQSINREKALATMIAETKQRIERQFVSIPGGQIGYVVYVTCAEGETNPDNVSVEYYEFDINAGTVNHYYNVDINDFASAKVIKLEDLIHATTDHINDVTSHVNDVVEQMKSIQAIAGMLFRGETIPNEEPTVDEDPVDEDGQNNDDVG